MMKYLGKSRSVQKNFRGTCLSVKMLKGYMVRKRLGTPDLGRCLPVTFYHWKRTVQLSEACSVKSH